MEIALDDLTDAEKVIAILRMEGPKSVKNLQDVMDYHSRSKFLKDVINPLIETGYIYRDGKAKSPTALIKIKRT